MRRKRRLWMAILPVVVALSGLVILLLLLAPVEAQGGWVIETVDSTGDVGLYTSLALDGSGYPHISYYGNGDLKYAYKDSSGWHFETVDSAGDVGLYNSLALDGSGYPHISYYDYTNRDLKYAYKDSSGWHIETVDTGLVRGSNSLALDEDGYPHIGYHSNRDLKYAYKDDAGWHIETVDAGKLIGVLSLDVGWGASLALDGSGYPHISYRAEYMDSSYSYSALLYAYWDGSGWYTETVDFLEDLRFRTGLCPSLALDGSGNPHVTFHREDPSGWFLVYTKKMGIRWRVGRSFLNGGCSSLVLDGDGYPHISYHYYYSLYGPGDLKYVYKDGSGWHVETVDSAGDVGWYNSLALDGSGYPHISYYDTTNGDLKYARFIPVLDLYLPLILGE